MLFSRTLRALGIGSQAALVLSAALLPPGADARDNKRPAVRLDLHADPLPEGALRRFGTVRLMGTGAEVAFSPDSATLYRTRGGWPLATWDARTGRRGPSLGSSEQEGAIRAVAFSPDKKAIAFAGSHGASVARGSGGDEKLVMLQRVKGGLSAAYSPDGKVLAVGGASVWLFDAARDKLLRTLSDPNLQAIRLRFSPDSKLLAVGSGREAFGKGKGRGKERRVYLFDANKGELLHTLELPEAKLPPTGGWVQGHLNALAFCDGGKLLATADWNYQANLFDVATGKHLRQLPGEVFSLDSSPDGKLLALGGRWNQIRLVEVATGKERWRVNDGGRVSSVAFSPDGKTVAAASYGSNAVLLFDAATGRRLHNHPGHRAVVSSLCFSPDGRRLATRGADYAIYLWDVRSGRAVKGYEFDREGLLGRRGQHGRADELHFAPDGQSLVFGCPEQETYLRVLDLGTGKTTLATEKAKWSLGSTSLSPDGQTAAGCAASMVACVWSLRTGKLRVLDAHGGPLKYREKLDKSVAFSPDGRTLAVGTSVAGVNFWDHARGELRGGLAAPGYEVNGLAYSPDGRALATWGGDYEGWALHELASGTTIRAFPKQIARQVAFSPAGDWLAVCSGKDGEAHLHNAHTGERVTTLKGHAGNVQALAFSPDGRYLATGGGDATALLWDLHKACPAPKPQRLKNEELQAAWKALAKAEAKAASPALWSLRLSGAQAVKLLGKELKAAPKLDEARLRKLIAQLDSDTFADREDASAELAKIAALVEADLRRAVEGKPSREQKRRLDALLKEAKGPLGAGAALQAVRGVQVLEGVGSGEAVAVLKRLAKGEPRAPLTRDASDALKRLARQAR